MCIYTYVQACVVFSCLVLSGAVVLGSRYGAAEREGNAISD